MTVKTQLDSLYEDFQNALFEVVAKAGTRTDGLFSTVHSLVMRITKLNEPDEYLNWSLASIKMDTIPQLQREQLWDCIHAVTELLDEASLNHITLDDKTLSRFDELLFYFKSPSLVAFEAVRVCENVRVSDMVPQGKGSNTTNVSLKRFWLLEKGHNAATIDITGTVLGQGYTPNQLESLVNTASARHISMDLIKSIYRLRQSCTVQQLITAAEHFDSADEVVKFAESISLPRRSKDFWSILLDAKLKS